MKWGLILIVFRIAVQWLSPSILAILNSVGRNLVWVVSRSACINQRKGRVLGSGGLPWIVCFAWVRTAVTIVADACVFLFTMLAWRILESQGLGQFLSRSLCYAKQAGNILTSVRGERSVELRQQSNNPIQLRGRRLDAMMVQLRLTWLGIDHHIV